MNFPMLAARFERATPQDILRWGVARFGARLTLGSGLGPSGIVLIHMLREIMPEPTLFFLDTGQHFEETYALILEIERRLAVQIHRLQPAQSLAEQAAAYGPELWQRDPDLCCHLRKVEPLRAYLAGYEAWVTAVRRDQGPTRAALPIISHVAMYGVVKLCPLATWSREQVWAYIHAHDLPYNPLHDQGYPSVGCAPCTRPVAPDAPERAGRWVGLDKTECGLHQPP